MAKRPVGRFGVWPSYSAACRRDVDALLRRGGSLSAFRSNPDYPVGPAEGSWAWRLEREAEAMFGARHVVACNSGTMALQAAFHALDLPAGKEVITTPYSFSATAAVIVHAGLVPVFADVDEWGCLERGSVSRVITAETTAILPVDLFGRAVGHRFNGLSSVRPPVIIEDACQAVGASLPTVRGGSIPPLAAGRYGVVGVWSFNGAKNVPAGEGGALVTDSEDYAERARRYISHGENVGWSRPPAKEVGLNGRLNELTACVATHGLRALLANNERRRHLAGVLHDQLGLRTDLALPDTRGHALYVYPIVLADGVDRAAFVRGLRARGIEVGEGYIRPALHRYPAFRRYQRIPLPMVEALSERRLCLLSQVRPPATVQDIRYLANCIEAVLDARTRRVLTTLQSGVAVTLRG